MYSEARKLNLIEEILKVKNESILSTIENLLKGANGHKAVKSKTSVKDFSGIWSVEEADEIEKIIAESCENIHPNDWK